jgi:hypothetical protein
VWNAAASKFLLLRHQSRFASASMIVPDDREVFAAWRPEQVWIEGENWAGGIRR